MSDECVRCHAGPADRALCVEVLRIGDSSVASSWAVRLCENCCEMVHGDIKRQTQFKQTKFKIGDAVGVRKGCENGWPFRERHTVVSVDVRWSVPIYHLDGLDCGCPETILEALKKEADHVDAV